MELTKGHAWWYATVTEMKDSQDCLSLKTCSLNDFCLFVCLY